MRNKAARLGIDNLFVMDGFLRAIPLPAGSADVLTCQAIGCSLQDKLAEIERVVKIGGIALHLFGTPEAAQHDNPLFQALVTHGYQPDTYRERHVRIYRYRKQVGT
ncbi:MAG: class I SAM-dependent methyltransferase [Acidimicrobiia bacterium]|nr:class I SAM-dependent methyltransferase [Acidimicrobiia bacterium]